MKLNISVKRIICFLLAVLMVLSVVGCKEKKKTKKKKVIRKTVVVRNEKDDENVSDNSNDSTPSDDSNDVENITTRAKRALLKAEEEEEVLSFDEIHKETFTPEFASQNVDWAGPEGYVIVYSPSVDKNGAPTNARVLAEKLKTFFKDNDNVDLTVYKDNDPALTGSEKMILVGDTAFKKSSLTEQEFALTLLDNGNLFFEGGHIVMAEKAVDWFRTIKRENGKLATLTGTSDDFTSKKTVAGMEFVYVWGDEFDGEEIHDDSKWNLGDHMVSNPDLAVVHTKQFNYVENGRLRLTGDRYLSEENAEFGWAHHGSYDTSPTMAFKNGYFEFDAKLSFTQGSLPPIWLMSNPETATILPREQYKAAWTVEVDIFETFSNGNQWDVSFHKYYRPYKENYDGGTYENGIKITPKDENGNLINQITYNGEVIYSLEGSKNNTNKVRLKDEAYAAHGVITQWRQYYDAEENQKQMYIFEGEALEKLNDTYHTYGYLHTKEGYKIYLDGECWLERDWDTAFDSGDGVFDCNNNNGFGFDLYYYLILNQYLYTAQSKLGEITKIKDNRTLPISSWYDNVRLYQLPDEIDILTPAYNE